VFLKPIDKSCGFLSEANAEKAINRESRVARPGIAVIPVPNTSNDFRQTGGGSGDDRSGGIESKKLQGQCRSAHLLPPASLVRAGREPIAPEFHRVLKQLFCFRFGGRIRNRFCGFMLS